MKFPYELKIFSVIMFSTLLIFSFSHFGVKAFEGIVSKTKGFPDNTWIGPINASGLEKEEVNQQLVTKIQEWQTSSSVQFLFKESNALFPIEEIIFKVEESVQFAKDAEKNALLIDIDDNVIQKVLVSISPAFEKNKVDIAKLETHLTTEISSLQAQAVEINIEDFLSIPEVKEQIVHTVSIPIINDDLQNIGATLIIGPKGTFSLLDFLEKQGLMELDPNIINIVSSGIYQSILQTNFEILERHISTELPEYIGLGYEAKVNANLKWDLSFYNPNEEKYKIEIFSDGESLIFDVVGLPFLYEYTVMQEGLQLFDPKTIKQYNPLLEPGQSKITKNGQKGYYIEVSRLILDGTGKLAEQQLVSKDYYSPVHHVVVFGLGTKDSDLSNEDKSSNIIPEETSNGQNDFENTVDIISPEEPDTSNDNTEEEPLWGRSDEIEK
jgi:hypothetical protein